MISGNQGTIKSIQRGSLRYMNGTYGWSISSVTPEKCVVDITGWVVNTQGDPGTFSYNFVSPRVTALTATQLTIYNYHEFADTGYSWQLTEYY